MAMTEHCNKLITIQQIKQATVIQLHDCNSKMLDSMTDFVCNDNYKNIC